MEELIVKIENAGNAARGGTNKGSSSKGNEQPKSFFDKMGASVKGGLKTAGVSFGVSSLLKQSQIFTSYVGSIFQILGGMIDMLLGPLMPIFIPVLKLLAKMMPGFRAVGEWVADKVTTIAEKISSWWKENAPGWMQGDGDSLAKTLGMVAGSILLAKFTGVWKLGKWFLGIKTGQKVAEKAAVGAAKAGTKTIGQVIRSQIGNAIKSMFSWLGKQFMKIPGVSQIAKFSKDMIIHLRAVASTVKDNILRLGKNILKHILFGSSTVTKAILKGIAAPFKAVGNFFWKLIQKPFNTVKGFVSKLVTGALKFFKVDGIFKSIKNQFGKVFNVIKGGPKSILTGLATLVSNVLGKPFTMLADALKRIPGVGKAVEGLKNLFKGGAGKLLGKVGGKAGIKAGLMSIPVLGAGVGAAFGAYETTRMVQKYGFNAKTLGAGLAYTGVQTAAGAAGGPVGIAAAIAGEVALNQFENRVLKVEVSGPDTQAQVSMKTATGKEQAIDATFSASDYQPGFAGG